MHRSYIKAFCLLTLCVLASSLYGIPAHAQSLTTLYSFHNSDGANPHAGLCQASDGNLYGATNFGGINGYGTIYRTTTSGTLTTLYQFTGGSDGAVPSATLIQASDGNLYGTTYAGGAYGGGTVFRITTSGTLTTLHSFSGKDGANPVAGLIQASDGNLYSTMPYGGVNGYGTVYRITTSGTLTTLYQFTGGNDGANPTAGLIQAGDGNLYSATSLGGVNGYGAVFKITTSGTLTTLYSFSNSDGANPHVSLIQASDGNLYGATSLGGVNGYGTVFRITTSGTLTTLYQFTGGNDGSNPAADLVQAGDGNLYGTTKLGGVNGYGTVFRITTSGTLTTLYSFTGGSDGGNPLAGLVQASNSNLYGTTSLGGVNGYGTVFQITLPSPIILQSATLTRTDRILARLTIFNSSLRIVHLTITSATLAGVKTTSKLPRLLAALKPKQNAYPTLGFPLSTGSSGTQAILNVSGVYTDGTSGTWSGSLTVTLP